ncbi:sulfotransferase [Lachnoclostridium sp. Marseille-P6806]|uniref:sulfotransferase n=1 Tax=Lachnoclostridium sp. Marseille-P6806 TaxID=2364793 RepID=UPI0013EEF9A0|nr:sulfotransferase [Lachnoclostridium sp. Marseille-P6806]
MNYEIFFDGHFMEYTKAYLEDLGGESYYLIHDTSGMTQLQQFISRVVNKLYYLLAGLRYKKEYGKQPIRPLNLFSRMEKNYMYLLDEKSFEEKTRAYMMRLFENISDREFFNIHELIPVHMIDECGRYFRDLYVIATERDPRDIFLTARHLWLTPDYPCYDVEVFCKYYRWTRTLIRKAENIRVLYVQFEDLVFAYDATVKQIENFLGLRAEDHIYPKKFFIPEASGRNCNLKNKFPEEAENIRIIERELSEWLYNFDEQNTTDAAVGENNDADSRFK